MTNTSNSSTPPGANGTPMVTTQSTTLRDFRSHAPGYWPEATEAEWSDWRWQLRHRITTLAQAEEHLRLTPT